MYYNAFETTEKVLSSATFKERTKQLFIKVINNEKKHNKQGAI